MAMANNADPDAEVVSLTPRTLLESDRYVCEICNQGFQRDQNLQMHRRRHKVPWKLLKREEGEAAARKRVFVCPEPSCLHHDPAHALGDLVGIKKHFRRKHSGHRQWACARCSKAYAVHSDYKAHLKTCGTRGHSCDCGRVFSRVESFIEHQDMCDAGGRPPRGDTTSSSAGRGGGARAASASTSHRQQQQQLHAAAGASLSRTASSASPSSGADLVGSPVAWPAPSPTAHQHNLELQLMPPRGTAGPIARRASPPAAVIPKPDADANAMRLELSIGVRFGAGAREDSNSSSEAEDMAAAARALKGEAREQLRLAAMEKAAADETRAEARRHAELAEQELAGARRMREQARAELGRAHAVRDHAVRQLDAALLEITCYGCRGKFRARAATMAAASYDVPSVVTEGEAGIGNGQQMALLQYDAADDRLPRGRRAMMDMN
ncbi:hypothetical protein BRADI_3g37890v3 [Brachypodium distachyon]|uniref:C2H2-type domain-containing protein n=1 Tax=Brachypodium distachyon TaxID=15368 RepID=A0A0Q3FHB7_BRADI|nr:hypothetical protein BRADI_3g37890v3 [Brachypodium distachyon]